MFGLTGGLFNGIFNNDWSLFKNQVISFASGFMFGGPIGGASAMITTSILSTPPGKQAIRWTAEEVYDDILGFSPRVAYILANIDLHMTGTALCENFFANFMGNPVQIQNSKLTDTQIEDLRKNGQYFGDERMFGPSLETKGSFERLKIKGLIQEDKLVGSFQTRTLDVPILNYLGAQHSSANVLDIALGERLNPFLYGTWGTCHQATNFTLLKAGISSTILDLGASWDMYVTTAIYGNYGGMLGSRVYSGINADKKYQKWY